MKSYTWPVSGVIPMSCISKFIRVPKLIFSKRQNIHPNFKFLTKHEVYTLSSLSSTDESGIKTKRLSVGTIGYIYTLFIVFWPEKTIFAFYILNLFPLFSTVWSLLVCLFSFTSSCLSSLLSYYYFTSPSLSFPTPFPAS